MVVITMLSGKWLLEEGTARVNNETFWVVKLGELGRSTFGT